MRELIKILIVLILATLQCATGAQAWDVEYDAATGLLPTEASPAWQFHDYGAGSGVDNGVLYIYSYALGSGYGREAAMIGAGVPVTMETRMSVQSNESGGAELSIGTYGSFLDVGVYPDRIVATDRYYQARSLWQDFTVFRTIRLAYDGNANAYIWVDGQLALSWVPREWDISTGPPEGIGFGSYESLSSWLYVDYSKEFLPIPEPASLLALCAGLVPLILRRRW